MKNKLISLTSILVFALTLTACQQTDVVANTAIKSFDKLLSADASKVNTNSDGGFVLLSPNDTEKFIFGEKATIEFKLAPFTKAGLDISELPDFITVDGDNLVISMENKNYVKDVNASKTFEKLVKNNRDSIGYHSALDHYGVSFGNGNVFEWAKDLATNDKDIVFALNPQPFIDAGVDVKTVKGWVVKKVEIMENGKKIQVDKLLKPYNVKYPQMRWLAM